MKNILFEVGVILFCSALMYSQETPTKVGAGSASEHGCTATDDEKAIRQIAEKWKNGYNDRDAAKVASLYAEDAYYLTQHFVTGIVHGRADIRAYIQRGVDTGYHIDSVEIISTGCYGSLAYTVGRYESTNAGQKAFGVNIVVLKKTGDRWLIVAHESAVPDPATAIQHLDTPKAH
jgi:uncharacterized protein (TIGR02246 family)